jgi:hypothetical protein
MFWTYLRRELRRRMRQAVFIALGLALGIGLVITVTSAATGVQNAQAAVLHSLYGVGTDLTVTQPPKQGSGAGLSFGFKQQIGIGLAGVRIEVTDSGRAGTGRTPQAASGAVGGEGHGIAGMRERAAIFGGTVDAGALPRGGFRVAAFLPVAQAAAGRVA